MSSVGSSFSQRKQKKMLTTGSAKLWTSVQLLTALQLTTLSAPVLLLGPDSNASTTNITDANLGSGAILNADSDLAKVFAASGSGLGNVGTTANSGELLRPLGKKFTVGTKVYGDLVTLQKVQRTDLGTTDTQGVAQLDTTGDGYATYWVVTDSFAAVSANSQLNLAAARSLVVAI